MVRINTGLSPKYLTDQHLLAENVEIDMLRNTNLKGKVTDKFKLGKGHILFFKDKLNYLDYRQNLIRKEINSRGFKKQTLNKINGEVEFKPTERERNIIIDRIIEKVKNKPEYFKYRGKKIKAKGYIKVLEKLKKRVLNLKVITNLGTIVILE